MKKKLPSIILVLIFMVGLGVLLYPTLSDFLNQYKSSTAIADYGNNVINMTEKDYENALKKAHSYNNTVKSNSFPRNKKDIEGNEEYRNTLNVDGNGMIGYIKIDKLSVRLPIFHGTSEPILQVGIGHMPLTSLPVGGESTHAVLSGHRGLPSAKLFSNLDKMEIGDVFYIYVLDEVLAYKVDRIKTVIPTNTKDLQIERGKDYITLVTCTPYGLNTHRLLVRGERIPYESTIAEHVNAGRNAIIIRPTQVALVIGLPIVTITTLVFLLRYRKIKGERKRK